MLQYFVCLYDRMIMKITKIKNAGILTLDEPIELKKISLFYGYNGAGKTTLSRLFNLKGYEETDTKYEKLLEKLKNNQSDELEFNLDNSTNLVNKIRVFNADFIKNNIFNENTKGITKIIISEMNAIAVYKINILEKLKVDFNRIYENFNENETKHINNKKSDENKKNTAFAECASCIKTTFNIHNYNKTKCEKDYKEYVKDAKDEDISISYNEVLSHYKKEIDGIYKSTPVENSSITKIDEIIRDINNIDISKINDDIKRVVEFIDININQEEMDWLFNGLKFHKHANNNIDTCKFCNAKQDVDGFKSRLSELEKLKNSEHQNHITRLKTQKESLLEIYTQVNSLNVVKDSIKVNITDDKVKILEYIKRIGTALKNKIDNYNDTNILDEENNHYKQQFIDKMKDLKIAYNKHNTDCTEKSTKENDIKQKYIKKTILSFLHDANNDKYYIKGFEGTITKLKKDINDNYNRYCEVVLINFNKLDKSTKDDFEKIINDFKFNDSSNNIENINELLKGQIDTEIKKIKDELSNTKIAIDEIQEHFDDITGNEIILKYDELQAIFTIEKNGKPMRDLLSEGEKTAFAFSYFLTSLNKNSPDNEDIEIIVIDDPISSLDYQIIYQVYNKIYNYYSTDKYKEISYLHNKNNKYLVLLTHNFYFANLLYKGFKFKDNTNYNTYKIQKENNDNSKIIEFKSVEKYLQNEYDFLLDEVVIYITNKDNIEPDNHRICYDIANKVRRFLEIYFNLNKQISFDSCEELDSSIKRWLHIGSHGNPIQDKDSIHKNSNNIKNHLKNLEDFLRKQTNQKINSKLNSKLTPPS
jgi:wobble nucleotide-excising tRNase